MTLEFPAFVSVTLSTLLFPTATFPKFKLEALAERSDVAAMPVPLKVTVLGELEMSLITDTVPDKAPAVFGEKMMLNVACFPAGIVRGNERPVIVTPAAAVLACVTVRVAPPPFEIVTDCVAVSPIATEPKPTDAGATDIVATPGVLCWLEGGLDALVRPMQPELNRITVNKRDRAATGIAFLPVDIACVARCPAPPNHSFILNFIIAAIVLCGKREGLLSQSTFEGQGKKPAPGGRLQGEAAGRALISVHSPLNWNRPDAAPIYGMVAETSVELTLSTLLESTDVTT